MSTGIFNMEGDPTASPPAPPPLAIPSTITEGVSTSPSRSPVPLASPSSSSPSSQANTLHGQGDPGAGMSRPPSVPSPSPQTNTASPTPSPTGSPRLSPLSAPPASMIWAPSPTPGTILGQPSVFSSGSRTLPTQPLHHNKRSIAATPSYPTYPSPLARPAIVPDSGSSDGSSASGSIASEELNPEDRDETEVLSPEQSLKESTINAAGGNAASRDHTIQPPADNNDRRRRHFSLGQPFATPYYIPTSPASGSPHQSQYGSQGFAALPQSSQFNNQQPQSAAPGLLRRMSNVSGPSALGSPTGSIPTKHRSTSGSSTGSTGPSRLGLGYVESSLGASPSPPRVSGMVGTQSASNSPIRATASHADRNLIAGNQLRSSRSRSGSFNSAAGGSSAGFRSRSDSGESQGSFSGLSGLGPRLGTKGMLLGPVGDDFDGEIPEASGESSGSATDVGGPGKGKTRDATPRPIPESPNARMRRERAPSGSASGSLMDSPPRSRRLSEYIQAGAPENRRVSVAHPNRMLQGSLSVGSPVPVSISTISPLNPLPSPWGSTPSEASSGYLNSAATSSNDSSTTGGAAIRLNRVPTSVRLATDMIKSQSPSASSGSGSNDGSRPTLGRIQSHEVLRSTSGPTPATPTATRENTPNHTPLEGSAVGSSASSTKSPKNSPPRSFRAEQAMSLGRRPGGKSPVRTRPSLPPPSAFDVSQLGGLTAALAASESKSGLSKYQQYRTSVHDGVTMMPGGATTPSPDLLLMPPPSAFHGSVSLTPHGTAFRDRTRSTADAMPPPKNRIASSPGIGLGLDVANAFDRIDTPRSGAGQSVSSGHSRQPSARSLDTESFLDGGDAHRHASMIMQSRKAKMQRWRPSSSGNEAGSDSDSRPQFGAPKSAASSNFLHPNAAAERMSGWRFNRDDRPLSADMDEPEPLSPTAMEGLQRTTTLPSGSHGDVLDLSDSLYEGIPRKPFLGALGGARMERDTSGTGSVNGIEWVDWLDEYKSLKAAKIKAEQEQAERQQLDGSTTVLQLQTNPSQVSPTTALPPGFVKRIDDASHTPSPSDTNFPEMTPSTSREEVGLGAGSQRPRSMSNMSQPSAYDSARTSPTAIRRMGLLAERPRQASYAGSIKSNHTSSGPNKKKKNLTSKMEGWWSAVKSNFAPPTSNQTLPASSSRSQGYVSQLRDAPGLSSGPVSAVAGPSGASLAHGHGITSTTKGLLVPQPAAHPPRQRLLRNVTSHSELAQNDETSDNGHFTTSRSVVDISEPAREPSNKPSTTTLASSYRSKSQSVAPSEAPSTRARTSSGLETRRNQPVLSLKLEPHVLKPPSHQRQSSNVSSGSNSSNLQSVLHMGRSMETPSPLNVFQEEEAENVQGSDREQNSKAITEASARQHITRRLAAAKTTCDAQLARIVEDVTFFVEAQIQQARQAQSPLDDDDENIMDSALQAWSGEQTDEELDSDRELGQLQRTPSLAMPLSHRAASRRGSISLATSPVKKLEGYAAMLNAPSSPGRRMAALSRTSRAREISHRLARNTSRANDIYPRSSNSSRSNSRSRSPMPGTTGLFAMDSINRDVRDAEPSMDGLIPALQQLIAVATDVQDTSVNTLVSKPATSLELVAAVQAVGHHWDDNPSWPGREWFVRLLLAVATLSRIVEWWEAERSFWNFTEDNQTHEPLTFVFKPAKDSQQFDFFAKDDTADAAPDHPRYTPMSGMMTSSTESSYAANQSPGLHLSVDTVALRSNAASPQPSESLRTAVPLDDLQIQAEHAKSVNIVMELSLGGEVIEWVNPAWQEVIGSDVGEACGSPISAWLAPADVSTLANASRHLEEDDSHTAQARFRLLRVTESTSEDEESDREPGPTFIEFEGIGMLMRDRDTGLPSHTMWVVKPVYPSSVQATTESPVEEPKTATIKTEFNVDSASTFPIGRVLSTDNLLCRICERQVPTWFFEKHNETCNEVHRLEADIGLANERLKDMCQIVQQLNVAIDESTAVNPAEYQGILVCPANGHQAGPPGQLLMAVQKIQHSLLEEAIDVLTGAHEIATPAVKEDAIDLPIQYQRLLSPNSEDRLSQISRWTRPETEDPALSQLFRDIDALVRQKQMAVNRMRNTIMYSERVRQEWEDKVDRMLTIAEEAAGSASASEDGSGSGDSSPTSVASEKLSGTQVEEANQRRGSLNDLPPVVATRSVLPRARLPVTSGLSPSQPLQKTEKPSDRKLKGSAPRQSSGGDGASSASSLLSERQGLNVSDRPGHNRRISSIRGSMTLDGPLSPRIPSVAPLSRTATTSINDFDVIKPISRGAFGSVYLAKKRATGDYYAIKALKKSDMIAKNQITNVKAERTILMNQASSPYVAKLFFSFQNKDYLYLVMEYLNGGDCATLIKTLGNLPEDWAKSYIAEVVLGLEYLHARGIVHRDIKPDNLLIDCHGHLKLTDFGLSRIGLLNRQMGGPRPAVLHGTNLRRMQPLGGKYSPQSSSVMSGDSPVLTPDVLLPPPLGGLPASYFSGHLTDHGSADESSESESVADPSSRRASRWTSSALRQPSVTPSEFGLSTRESVSKGPEPPKFVGTPDYLCPESILGIGSDDASVDWWALGVVMYEFIYGFPPFHAETPDKVFDNIVSRRINWYEEEMELSAEARDLMERLMCTDPKARLGSRGADEVKQHAFFAGIDWATVTDAEANFIPNITNPESTDYFDARGALPQVFTETPAPEASGSTATEKPSGLDKAIELTSTPKSIESEEHNYDDFGTFTFKNLPVLKQANDEVIKKLRSDSMAPLGKNMPAMLPRDRRLSIAGKKLRPKGPLAEFMPPSPATSTSSSASTPSRASMVPPLTPGMSALPHMRRPSEQNPLDRVKLSEDLDSQRRKSAPERNRAASGSEGSDRGSSFSTVPRHSSLDHSVSSVDQQIPAERKLSDTGVRGQAVDVLIAEDNPISQKMLETLLTRMGCRCVCVNDGAEALAAGMGDIHFDIIICDLMMPNISGEEVARMIRSTQNANVNTPIIAATSYEQKQVNIGSGTIFSAILSKPISKMDLVNCLAKLGFILGSADMEAGGDMSSTPGAMSMAASVASIV